MLCVVLWKPKSQNLCWSVYQSQHTFHLGVLSCCETKKVNVLIFLVLQITQNGVTLLNSFSVVHSVKWIFAVVHSYSIAICGCLKCSFSSSGSFGFCWHGVKVGPRTSGPWDPGPEPPSKFKSGTRDPPKV